MRSRTVLILASGAMVLTACGSSAGSPRVTPRNIPTGADVAVIRIDTRGGFTSAETQLRIVPELTVLGDGRVIVSGPVTEQYPPHALPNLLTGRLRPGSVDVLFRQARAAGLLGAPLDFGRPGVTDMPTTTVTFTLEPDCPAGASCTYHHVVQHAYALDAIPDHPVPNRTDDERQARDRLRRFVRAASAAAAGVATAPYRASEVAIYIRGVSSADDGSPTGIDPGRAQWPLGDLATLGRSDVGAIPMPSTRCAVLTGADAARALAAAANASAITHWQSNGAEYTIVWRPLLPDEHACP